MARPRINKSKSPTSKGKGTSFGKKSEAEKSFKNKRKSSGRNENGSWEKPSYGKSPRSSSTSGSSYSKPSGFRRDDTKGDSRGERPFSDKPQFRKSNKPYGIRPDGDRFSRPDGPPRFSKPSGFRSNEPREDRKDDKRDERAPRYGKSPEGERPFRKSSGSFSNGPRKFDKPFSKEDGDKKPFDKTKSPPSFGSRPDKFRSEPREEGAAKPRITKDDFKKTSHPARNDENEEAAPRKKYDSFDKPYKKSFVQSRVSSSTDFSKSKSEPKIDDGLTRLNKYIANSGVGSRREADELIKMGLISVNGTVITELGSKVKQGDVVRYEDKVLKAETPVYILLNKPKGFITTTDDPQERNTVMSLVAGACKERIYPVGRLDRNTTGLLLLTNDGDLADKLMHPSYKAKKVYRVDLDKPLTKNDFLKIQEGVHLPEGKAMVDDIAMLSDDSKSVGLEIHIGWNRVVRRIFETLGYVVVKLDRSVYAGLDKKDVGRGQWRFLKAEEVVRLKHFK
jgi:23S rRNA pseudouridine2605 synthase